MLTITMSQRERANILALMVFLLSAWLTDHPIRPLGRRLYQPQLPLSRTTQRMMGLPITLIILIAYRDRAGGNQSRIRR